MPSFFNLRDTVGASEIRRKPTRHNPVNNGMNYQPQLVSWIFSINSTFTQFLFNILFDPIQLYTFHHITYICIYLVIPFSGHIKTGWKSGWLILSYHLPVAKTEVHDEQKLTREVGGWWYMNLTVQAIVNKGDLQSVQKNPNKKHKINGKTIWGGRGRIFN